MAKGSTLLQPRSSQTDGSAGVNGSRLRASGAYSLEEIEAIWGAALGEMEAYDTFLDNHLALWAPDLAPYVERFQAAAVPALGLRWAFRGERYASLLVHVPKSQVVLELISQTAPPGVRQRPASVTAFEKF